MKTTVFAHLSMFYPHWDFSRTRVMYQIITHIIHYLHAKNQKNLGSQSWENMVNFEKKPEILAIFDSFFAKFGVTRFFFKNPTPQQCDPYKWITWYKKSENLGSQSWENIVNIEKTWNFGYFRQFLAKFGVTRFFFKNPAPQ